MRAAVLAACLLLTGCVSTRVDNDGTIQTPSEASRSGIAGAVSAPLRDMNVLRTKIPGALLIAWAEPYARPADRGCSGLIAEVRSLDEALGPDADSPEVRARKKALRQLAGEQALGMVADTAQDLIPFRGWVRKLSGAERHDRLVAEAVQAGHVRRAYLKGLGEARGCNPPGTPQHLAETPEVPTQYKGPLYDPK